MQVRAHMKGGIVLGLVATYLLFKDGYTPDIPVMILSSVAGSILPDIDHPKSFIGSQIPLLPKYLYSNVGHRTLTHCFLFAILIGIFLSFFNPWVGTGLFVGILSHIILDSFTPRGVAILYPITDKKFKLWK